MNICHLLYTYIFINCTSNKFCITIQFVVTKVKFYRERSHYLSWYLYVANNLLICMNSEGD